MKKPYEIIDVNGCPKQEDANSCGVFVYKNMECLIFNDGRFNYSQANIIKIRNDLKERIINKMRNNGQILTDARTNEFLKYAKLLRDRTLKAAGLTEEGQILNFDGNVQ